MKNPLFFLRLFGGLLAAWLLGSCGYYVREASYVPKYVPMDTFRSAVEEVTDGAALLPSAGYGKMTLSADRNFLFISETDKGIRVADIRDPAAPRWLGRIALRGNRDLSFLEKSGRTVLFADSYLDLVAFELSLPTEPQGSMNVSLLHRVKGAFPLDPSQILDPGFWEWGPPQGVNLQEAPADSVLAGYEEKIIERWVPLFYTGPVEVYASGLGTTSGGSGATGSLARFALWKDPATPADWYLYAVGDKLLRTFQIGTAASIFEPSPLTAASVGWAIETIFPYREQLYLGSESALYIYSLKPSPQSPTKISQLPHGTARDPVVVAAVGPLGQEKDTAFVTLGAGSGWFQGNVLIAIGVSDPVQPIELTRRNLNGPRGLGFLDNRYLAVCKGEEGIALLDVSKVRDVDVVAEDRLPVVGALDDSFPMEDIIPGPLVQIVSGPQGVRFYQYAPAGPSLTLLGKLQ